MAEDGEESDEIKEEYGKRVDETLAGLREKLEEARRAEGKPPLLGPSQNIESSYENEASSRPGVVVDMDASGLQRVTELQSALVASQEMVYQYHLLCRSTRTLILDLGLSLEVRA